MIVPELLFRNHHAATLTVDPLEQLFSFPRSNREVLANIGHYPFASGSKPHSTALHPFVSRTVPQLQSRFSGEVNVDRHVVIVQTIEGRVVIAASSLLRNSTLSSAAYSIAVTKASRQSALRMETFIYISFFISSVRDQFRVTATPQWYVLPPPLTLPVVSTVAREVGCEFYREPGVWRYSRYPRRALDLEGCRILRMALASIWRIRSRVRPN